MSDHHMIPADQILPSRLFVIPMRGKPVFPGILTPLMLPAAVDADAVEKAIAARRNRIRQIIIPAQNRRDLEQIPDHVRKGITFHMAETMDDVLKRIF